MKKPTIKQLTKRMLAFTFLFTLFSCAKIPVADTVKQEKLAVGTQQSNNVTLLAGENAAPSQHIFFTFPSDAIAKIHKIKITQSANTEYFSVHNYSGGYAGLQQTPDQSFGTPNILISSLWDPNTTGGVYSRVAYSASNTVTSRFGGEGDGWKTINPYQWSLNTWYNIALRAWKRDGELFVGTFIQNMSTGTWFHTYTLAMVERTTFLGSGNDSFLENWVGTNPNYDGSFIRKAFFKDCWNLNTSNTWQKHSSRTFSANANDAGRNGIYDRAFNSGYDATEDAYFMEHGGNVQPSAAFGTGRTLSLPVQTNQGSAPTLTVGTVSSVSASYTAGTINVSWTTNATKTPQLSSKVEILNGSGTVVQTVEEVLPQKRTAAIPTTLAAGNYTARVTITDIFNQVSAAVTAAFAASGSSTWYKIKNFSSGLYLSIENNSTANNAYVVQSTSSTNYGQQWQLSSQSGATVLINRNSNKAIDVAGSIQTSGVNLIQYQVTNNLNQQWNLVSVGSGKYYIQSNLSNHYVLDNPGSSTTSGTKMILYTLSGTSGGNNQQWVLEPQ
ncbi:DUF3472 domain-containing protein [Pedobacter frigoris]|uniref:DUF3472 domain-containing protein n=1 Tax=Pedobacter frigoris TaxID=2571272 RepID=UPI0029315232|nr:RICIN domain-containing protein [Pedobacter frigoris]